MPMYEFRTEAEGPFGLVTLSRKSHRQGELPKGQSIRFTSAAEDYWLRINEAPDTNGVVRLCAGPLTYDRLIFEGWKEINT